MSRMAIFIDGGYIGKVIDSFGRTAIDFSKLANWIAGHLEIFRIYYYDCLPYVSNPPHADELELLTKKQRFFNSLNRRKKFEVREGRLACRGISQDGERIFQQKRIDTLLGVDIARIAFKNVTTVPNIAILTGDSDYIPAIQVAKDEGILVHLIHGPDGSYHQQLWDIADERRRITKEVLDKCRM
jgi:uncharacterized LabA/DUF88 family protein